MFCMKRDKVLHSKQIYHHHAMMILVVDCTLSLTFDLDTYVNSSVQVSDNLIMLKKNLQRSKDIQYTNKENVIVYRLFY